MAAALVLCACGRSFPEAATLEPSSTDAGSSFVPDAEEPSRPDGGIPLCEGPDRVLEVDGFEANFDVYERLGRPLVPLKVQIIVNPGATIGSSSPGAPALTSGNLAFDSIVCVDVYGQIVGAGGAGGSGGTGLAGRDAPCGRPGQRGGDAVEVTVRGRIFIANGGRIAGGGGGGGGAADCGTNAGGGGGAGSLVGRGGEGASAFDRATELAFCGAFGGIASGVPGMDGLLETGGTGGGVDFVAGGRGGDLGRSGTAGQNCTSFPGGNGGLPGYAATIGTRPVIITGPGEIVGPLDL